MHRPFCLGWLLVVRVVVALWPLPLPAHTLDTSYARVEIGTHEVVFKFTYDFQTLVRMTGVDTNADERISRDELQAAVPAIRGFIRDHVYLEINQREAEFEQADPVAWPDPALNAIPRSDYNQRLVTFVFRNPVLSAPEDVSLTFDFFEQLGQAHTVLGVFAWKGHEEEVIFTRFEPDYLYDTGYQAAATDRLSQYFQLGVKHIFLGYDHIAFLLALLFVSRFRDLLKIITSFTIAHTITLALAVLRIIELRTQWVEIGVAATIMFVALENFWVRDTSWRWILTFFFGLIHGFSFAHTLRALGLPSAGLAQSLASFNIGVEAAQLSIVAGIWPLLRLASHRSWFPKLKMGVSAIIFVFGALWFTERLLGVKWLPF